MFTVQVRIQCNLNVMWSRKYNWKHDEDRCGGALNMFGCHIIDLLLYLLNETTVSGTTISFYPCSAFTLSFLNSLSISLSPLAVSLALLSLSLSVSPLLFRSKSSHMFRLMQYKECCARLSQQMSTSTASGR